jgi:putative tricarboxylic transport membrane protein
MRVADIVSGAILFGLGVLAAAATLELPYWTETTPGPAFAARWVALIGVVLGTMLIAEALSRTDSSAIEWPEREGIRRVLLTIALLWAFCVLLPTAGFVLSALAFMLTMLLGVQRRQLLPSVLASAITVAGCYGIFIVWLQVKLPMGPWGL